MGSFCAAMDGTEWALLMRAGNAGDADSYRRLLLQLTPVLRAVARRGLARAGMADTDAEDVVQETLVAIHLKRQSWNEDAPFGPRRLCCRTQNIALEEPNSQLNAQRNMESLTASFITWIVEPSSALKMRYRDWEKSNR